MADDARKRGEKIAPKHSAADPDQSQRFIEGARELGADQPEEAFDDALRRIGRTPARKGGKAKKPPSKKE